MKELFYVIGCFAFLSCNMKSDHKNNRQPNVVFILADDLGYSDLSCMGSSYYETPNIDKIASKGMLFTNGYAGCQVCSPSRATLMTGQFTARHGITDWIGSPSGKDWRKKKRYTKVLPAAYEHHMKSDQMTLPKAFQQAGYTTFFAGKWHIGDKGYYPENFGFEINKGGFSSGSPRGGYFGPFNNPKLKNKEKGENLTMRLAEETSAFIKSTKDKPFFAYLSFYAVHGPIQTSKEKWKKYRDKAEAIGIAKNGFEEGDLLPMRKHQDNPVYGGLVETMDDAVGLVLQTLKENDLDKNTIVVFTSDNGGVTSGDNYSTNCMPLKGGKGYQWEGGIRIPYMISVPWLDNHGKKSDEPVSGTDFFPTLLDLAGQSLLPEIHVDGKSIVSVLNGESLEERPLYWHYPHYGNQGGRPVSIIRKGDWKLIHYWEDGHDELYNLKKDVHEDHNLGNSEIERTKVLSETLLNWLSEVDAQYPEVDPLYNKQKEDAYVSETKKRKMRSLEMLRYQMLDKEWEPNRNWWGSIPTKD